MVVDASPSSASPIRSVVTDQTISMQSKRIQFQMAYLPRL
jgi:hypothetical protein